MSDISKDELKKEIAGVLKDADLGTITSKKVRQEIEKKLAIDLASRRKEVDELVMEYIDNDKGKSKKNGNVEDDDDEEEEEEENENEEEDEEEEEDDDEDKKPKRSAPKKAAPPVKRKAASSEESEEASDDEGDDEYSPKKKSSKKAAGKRGGRKKKGGSDDDSDEDWGKGKGKGRKPAAKKAPGAKRSGGGYTKAVALSPALAALVGEEAMARHEVVKRVWAIIKERNLYDPKNKQFAICDDELLKVFGVKRFRTFGMMKFLKNHFVG